MRLNRGEVMGSGPFFYKNELIISGRLTRFVWENNRPFFQGAYIYAVKKGTYNEEMVVRMST